ncbi:MAG: hypothetical protein JNM34_11795 [Chthonomonadaceae bacterium]|nr:hypothetical protein [Chthonomonadaceae bacterium]
MNELLAKITLVSTGAAAIFTGMVRGVTSRGDAHETDERCAIESLYKMSRIYAHLFWRLATM